jgi:hypothetical protein
MSLSVFIITASRHVSLQTKNRINLFSCFLMKNSKVGVATSLPIPIIPPLSYSSITVVFNLLKSEI